MNPGTGQARGYFARKKLRRRKSLHLFRKFQIEQRRGSATFGLMRPLLLPLLLIGIAGFSQAQDTPKPKDIPETYRKLFQQAVMSYEQQNFEAALKTLDEADAAFPNYSETYNLKGGIYTQMRDFPKARELFTKALELNADSYPVRFNLAEIEFLEKKYDDSRKAFESLRKTIEADKVVSRDAVSNLLSLIDYKVFLTYLLQDNMAEAERIQKNFSFADNTPNYYFGNAAMAFKKNDTADGQSWLSSADRIYPPQLNRLYADSFFEIGWIQKPAQPAFSQP